MINTIKLDIYIEEINRLSNNLTELNNLIEEISQDATISNETYMELYSYALSKVQARKGDKK